MRVKLEELYAKIPGSQCPEGCSDCCKNSIQMTDEERRRMGGYTYEGECPYRTPHGCTAYQNRPFVCRIYGVSELLTCSKCKPSRLLSPEETNELVHIYCQMLNPTKK